jgi:hypothetical protein
MAATKIGSSPKRWLNESYLELLTANAIDDFDRGKIDEWEEIPLFEEGNAPTLSDDHDTGRQVRSLREYRQAVAEGFYPVTTHAISTVTGFFQPLEAVVGLLRKAKVPAESFIDEPRVGVSNVKLMPASVLQHPFEEVDTLARRPQVGTIYDLVEAGLAAITDVGTDFLRLEFHFGDEHRILNSIFEVMRADLDGDGIEDILVDIAVALSLGSFNYSALGILRRKGPDEPFSFELIELEAEPPQTDSDN